MDVECSTRSLLSNLGARNMLIAAKMVPFPVSAVEKFQEAVYFFNQMIETQTNVYSFPYNLSAFLSAFRAMEREIAALPMEPWQAAMLLFGAEHEILSSGRAVTVTWN